MMILAALLTIGIHGSPLPDTTSPKQPLVAAFAAGAFESGPVWWSSVPFFVLYEDGTIIYRSEPRGEPPAFDVVHLSRSATRSFLDSLQLEPDFFRLNSDYDNAPGAYDLPIFTLWAWQGHTGKFVSLTGTLDSTVTLPRVDPQIFHAQTPSGFIRVFARLTTYSNPDSKSWKPEAFEVVLFGAGVADSVMQWPLGWPALGDPNVYEDWRGDFHVPLTPAQVGEYFACCGGRDSHRTFSWAGKKWAVVLRPVLPGDRNWTLRRPSE